MINELVSAVRIALSQETVAACEAADGDGSGTVMINELVEAVRTALEGCTVRADSLVSSWWERVHGYAWDRVMPRR